MREIDPNHDLIQILVHRLLYEMTPLYKDSTDFYKNSLFFIKIELVMEVPEGDIRDHPMTICVGSAFILENG